jgi:hypothetical protein
MVRAFDCQFPSRNSPGIQYNEAVLKKVIKNSPLKKFIGKLRGKYKLKIDVAIGKYL